MKLSNNGFTFVEILAVIVIIGLLTGISIAAFSRYKEKALKGDYEALARSSYNAMEEYTMSHPYDDKVSLETLENENLLSNRKDPASKDTDCTGTVEVSKNAGSNGKLDDGEYKVYLCCVSIQKVYTYPGGKESDLTDRSKCEYVPEDIPEEPPTPGTTYTLHYNDNNGSGCSNKSITKNAGEAWGSLCTPTRSGYKFNGWKYGNETVTSSSIANGNITVKAQWISNATQKYTCAAGKYLPKNKTKCSICKNAYYCKGGTWPKSTTKDQGLTPCPTGYNNSASGSKKETECYMKVTKNHFVKTKKAPKSTACGKGMQREAHNVFYGKTSSCVNSSTMYTLTIKKDSNINSVKLDGVSTTSKKVKSGATVKVEVGAKNYYHPKWGDNNSTVNTRNVKVTKNITLTVSSVKNQITINYYSNGGSLTPGSNQKCPVLAGCKKNKECIWPQLPGCKNKTGLVYVGEYAYDSISYASSGIRDYRPVGSLYLTKKNCIGTNKWIVGSVSGSRKIDSLHNYANYVDFYKDAGIADKIKNGNTSLNLYAEWTCSPITCAAGKYLPKNKISCTNCTGGNYCKGGKWYPNSAKDQGLTPCPTGYTNSPAGSKTIIECYMKVNKDYYVKTVKASAAVPCGTGYTKGAHTVKYGSISTKCNAKKVNVTFNCNGGSGGGNQTFTYGVANQKFGKACTKSGKHQDGWNLPKNKNASAKDYNVNASVWDSWINNNSPSITLNAHWVGKPTCTIKAARGADSNGWYSSNVNLSLNISGVATSYGIADTANSTNMKTTFTASKEGTVKYYGYVKNAAGSNTCQITIKLDKTKPTATPIFENTYHYTIHAKIKDKTSGIVKYKWGGHKEENYSSPVINSELVTYKVTGAVSDGDRHLYIWDNAGNKADITVKAYKEFTRLISNHNARSYKVGNQKTGKDPRDNAPWVDCRLNADYVKDKNYKNHPYASYDFHMYNCYCKYDYYTGAYHSQYKESGKTYKDVTRSEHENSTGDGIAPILIFYQNNSKGVKACKDQKNSYVFSVCYDGEYPRNSKQKDFHGYRWYSGEATKYSTWKKNTYYHNHGNYDSYRVASSSSVSTACKNACQNAGHEKEYSCSERGDSCK